MEEFREGESMWNVDILEQEYKRDYLRGLTMFFQAPTLSYLYLYVMDREMLRRILHLEKDQPIGIREHILMTAIPRLYLPWILKQNGYFSSYPLFSWAVALGQLGQFFQSGNR